MLPDGQSRAKNLSRNQEIVSSWAARAHLLGDVFHQGTPGLQGTILRIVRRIVGGQGSRRDRAGARRERDGVAHRAKGEPAR